jgi:hypothetical protein
LRPARDEQAIEKEAEAGVKEIERRRRSGIEKN